MQLKMDEMLRSLAMGLDAVESDFLGASTNHGARIATLCAAMGKQLGLTDAEQTTVAACALLHDNALTEYILSERPGSAQEFNMVSHCVLGQQSAEALPFPAPMAGYILYHHEQADGGGPFGKKAGDCPLGAQLIAIADMLDSQLHLQRWQAQELPLLQDIIKKRTDTHFTQTAADAMLAVLDADMLQALRDENIYFTVSQAMPAWQADLSEGEILRLASFVGHIIDYKSAFTKKHSSQVANIAWHMAQFYGINRELRAEIYLAAALHDIGKLFVPTAILEKPGALTKEEFGTIQSHVWWTRELLCKVTGLENICNWASNHHEKLDGTGYPEARHGRQLDFVSRLLCCIDIYQAVGDNRPYHPARSHTDTMAILQDMVYQDKLDKTIVADLGSQMEAFPVGAVPPPPIA